MADVDAATQNQIRDEWVAFVGSRWA